MYNMALRAAFETVLRRMTFTWYCMLLLVVIPTVLLGGKLLSLPFITTVALCDAWSPKCWSVKHAVTRAYTLVVFPVYVRLCYRLLGVRRIIVNETPIASSRTIILANHRSWADFVLDNQLCNASSVSRRMVTFGLLCTGLLLVLERRQVLFHRGQTSKETLYDRLHAHVQRHEWNVLLYPEGTRRRHVTLSDIQDAQSTLKPGLLWMIYTKGHYPVLQYLTTKLP